MTYLVPSTVFRLLPLSFFIWSGVVAGAALFFCYRRTRSGSHSAGKTKSVLEQYFHFREFTFPPFLVFIFLLIGSLMIRYGDDTQPLLLNEPVHLSRFQSQEEIPLNDSFRSKGILIVSNLTGSITIPDKTPVASVIILGQEQRFESFSMKAGKDTSEETLERQEVNNKILHRRAAIYRSWNVETGESLSFEAHEYYTKFLFSRPLKVQKITLKLLGVNHEDLPSDLALHIKKIVLIQ
jgi:hypothetical protein